MPHAPVDCQGHRCEAVDAEDSCSTWAEVDDSSSDVRASVVDAYGGSAAVALVVHRDNAADGQGLVGGSHGVWIHVLAICRDSVVVNRSNALQPTIVVGVDQVEFSATVEISQLSPTVAGSAKVCCPPEMGTGASGIRQSEGGFAGLRRHLCCGRRGPRKRRCDVNSCRKCAGKGCGQEGGLDRTAFVLIPQNDFLSLVCTRLPHANSPTKAKVVL